MEDNRAYVLPGKYRNRMGWVGTLLAATLLGFAFQNCFAGPTVTVEYRVFPGLAEMDGNWSALFAASDGKVYAGLACHGCSGHLVYYDSKKDKMIDVGDLNTLTGEQGLNIGPQSKIHTRFGEGKDGRIYFATHGGWWFDYSRFATPEGYPGAHYMAYDPRSGQVQDFGIGATLRRREHRGLRSQVQSHLWADASARSLCLLRCCNRRQGGQGKSQQLGINLPYARRR